MKINKLNDGFEIIADRDDYEELRGAILFVSGACSTDKTLPAFNHVNIEVSETGFTLVATDRYRMHWVNFGLGDQRGIAHLVPANVLKDMVKNKSFNGLTIKLQESTYEITNNGARITGDLYSGQFPNWMELIPNSIEPVDSIMFGSVLGETLKNIASAYGKSATICASFAGKLKAIYLDTFADDAHALVMPKRG